MQELSETSPDKTTKLPAKRRRWSFWRILSWAVVSILLIVLVAAAYAWTHRYALIENAAHDILAEQGIESEFAIKSISKTRAVMGDVQLSSEGSPFFEAREIIAEYAWRDALEGRMQKLVFKKPTAWVSVDEKGKIIDGWLPPTSSEEGGGNTLPEKGIFVDGGTLFLGMPYGKVEAHVSAHITSFEQFEADLVIKPTALDYHGIQAAGQGAARVKYDKAAGLIQTDIDLKPTTIIYRDMESQGSGTLGINLGTGDPSISVDLMIPEFNHPKVQAKALTIRGNFVPLSTDNPVKIDGSLDFTFDEITTQEARTGKGTLNWDGIVTRNREIPNSSTALGKWQISAKGVKLRDPVRRNALAESLSLNNALSSAPISADFADGLTEIAEHIFAGSELAGSGELDYTYDDIAITLSDPFTLKAPKASLRATPSGASNFYKFDRGAETLALKLNAVLTGPYPASLKDMELQTTSKTGYSLEAVNRFTMDVNTPQTWTASTPEDRPVRLAPFKASIDYEARRANRKLSMSGSIDYDGDIPAGYVTGLNTSGRLDVALLLGGLETVFHPEDDQPITMKKFETPVGWWGENLSFNLVSETPFYMRRGSLGTLEAEMTAASGVLIDDAEARLAFQTLKANGTLEDGHQNWNISAEGIHVMSDDLPGIGTDVRAETGVMTVALLPGGSPQFTLQSPSADIKSRLVNADHLSVDVSGTPDNFKLNYKDGLIKFTADALPALPMTGDVIYANGQWIGEAETYLPKAGDAPIDIVYRFKDGLGEADVTIDRINFVPGQFQPQSLLPALRGKVSRVEGTSSADIKLSFGVGQPLKSSGLVKIYDMNAGTLPGPFEGVNTEIEFTSLFPVQTEGRQKLTLRKFDPGLPLENGMIEYELLPNAVRIHSASWPMGAGSITIDPVTWDFGAEENRVVLRVENVSLGDFLSRFGGGDIKATGEVVGVLPVVIKGVDVKVENGVVGVPNGGVIQFESRHTDAAGSVNETADMAFEALKNFKYNSLEIQMNGPLDGEITVLMDFLGSNPDVFYGTKFHFKVNIQGELVNIARSFKQSQDSIAALKSLKNLDNVSIIPENDGDKK